MLLGAFLSAGLDEASWRAELGKIALPRDSFKVVLSDTKRTGIACKKIDVQINEHDVERHLTEILEIIDKSAISAKAKDLAKRIFTRLGEAEARVHGVPVEEIHFHEVGAIDAIVDIVGFAIAYDLLKIELAVCSPLPVGSGTVEMAHGTFPIPGPAVLNLIQERGAPILSSPIEYECLTPTGAAILTTIADRFDTFPSISKIDGIGYGAGTKESPKHPNVTRVVLGQSSSPSNGAARFDSDEIVIIEANIDDFSPQALAFATERFLSLGALDVTVVPATMKKSRSGHIITVLSTPEKSRELEEAILTETTTIGIRSYSARRTIALREFTTVKLDRGTIRVKVAKDRHGKTINAQPEFDDCALYAMENGLPIKDVMSQVAGKLASQ